MIAASDCRLPGLTGPAETRLVADAALFAFLDELRECEKRRDELLNRLSIEEGGGQIEAVAKTACDAARAIYARIATIKPTTVAGVLRQLELAAGGWVAPSTVPVAMAGLREIARRPPPLKMGRLPPVPSATGLPSNADVRHTAPRHHTADAAPPRRSDGR